MLALEPDVLVLEPHLRELGDGLFPDLLGVVHIGHTRYEPEDLVRASTASAAELEAVLGEMVEHGDLLGDLHGVVDLGERVEDAGAEVDPVGGVCEVAEVDVVGGEVRVLLQEVVFGGPGVLEAGPVGLDDVLGLLHQRLVLGERVGLGALAHVSLYKEPEFQGGSPSPRSVPAVSSDGSSDSWIRLFHRPLGASIADVPSDDVHARQPAAVDHEGLAGDVGGVVTGEEEREPRHLLGPPDPPQRHELAVEAVQGP